MTSCSALLHTLHLCTSLPAIACLVACRSGAAAQSVLAQHLSMSWADALQCLPCSRPTVTSGASLQASGPSLGPLGSAMNSCAAASHQLFDMSATRMPSLNASMCLDDFLTAVIA